MRARARVSTGSKVGMGQATLDAAIHTLNAIRVHPVSIYHFQTLVHGFLGHVISYRDGEGWWRGNHFGNLRVYKTQTA